MPGTRPVPSAPTKPTWASTSGCTRELSRRSASRAHDAAHEVRAARGERRGEHAAAALADDRHALAGRLRELLQPLLEPRAGDLASSRRSRGCRRAACASRSRAASASSSPASRRRPGSRGSAAPARPSPSGTPPPPQTRSCGAARPHSRPSAALAPERRDGEVREADAACRSVSTRLDGCQPCHVGTVADDPTADGSRRLRVSIARMRAATIRDGEIAVAEHPGSRAAGRRAARPRPRRRPQRRRHAASSRAATRRRRARRPTSPASSWPARSSRAGRGVERFEPGDRVMAIVAGGGQAELAVVHERAAMPVPDELDWTAAGGVPEVFTTAHDALFTQARPDRRRAAARPRRRGRRRHGRGPARRRWPARA